MMRGITDSHFRNVIAALAMAASGMTLGCSSEASPADLTASGASAIISQKWSRDELDHLRVSFHSDTVVECGVRNDLWKPIVMTDRGYTRTAYQLTEKGSKVMFSVDLKESGKGHEITLRGPYHFEITGITQGSQPDTRNVDLRWEIDWEKVPAELKACAPKFELSGHEIALFKLYDREWRFLSYLKPEDAPPPPAATP